MSGRLKASSEPSSFTGASSAALSGRWDQDQGVGSVLPAVPFGVYDGQLGSDDAGA
jgi:hypothetical protein